MFDLGRIYNRRRDIHDRYGGQRQGGICTPRGLPAVFIFTGDSGHAHGYRDEFRDDGLYWYTGEGQRGDMEMVRGNLAIRDHERNGKSIYMFEDVGSGNVRYFGEGRYVGHHTEERPDHDGVPRSAIIFELELVTTSDGAMPESLSAQPINRLWSMPLDSVRVLAVSAPPVQTTPTERRSNVRRRSAAVRVYVLRRANGTCEACGKPAPFETRQRRPYLEPHHILRVADGGPDHPRFVAAICPNCHREAHHGRDADLLNDALLERLASLEST